MPTRILREGILTDELVDRLDFGAEVFYRRLMSVADDFGRFSADPRILLAALYPLRIEEVHASDVARWRDDAAAAGLLNLYAVDGKRCLEILKFGQRTRATTSRYPAPVAHETAPRAQASDTRGQMPAPVGLYGDGDGDGDVMLDLTVEPGRPPDDGFPAFWGTYPRKTAKAAALKSWGRLKPEDRAEALSALPVWAEAWAGVPSDFRSTCPHPATWINGRRWEDPPDEVRAQAARAIRDSRPAGPARLLAPIVGKSALPPAPTTKRNPLAAYVPLEVVRAAETRDALAAWEARGCTDPRPRPFRPADFYGPDSRDDEATRLHFWELGDDEAFTRNREKRSA